MKNKKIFRVLAVVLAVLFCTALAVTIAFTASSKHASAEEMSDGDIMLLEYSYEDEWEPDSDWLPIWERYEGETVSLSGDFTIDSDIVVRPEFDTGGKWLTFEFLFVSNGYFCDYMTLLQDGDSIVIDYHVLEEVKPYCYEFNEVRVYEGEWESLDWSLISIGYTMDFPKPLYYWLSGNAISRADSEFNDGFDAGYIEGKRDGMGIGFSVGYDEGYNEGYDEGYGVGYDDRYVPAYNEGYDNGFRAGGLAGYNSGLNKGHSDNIGLNPISNFLTPVSAFINLPLFGNFSIGTLLNLVLFVGVALIFIKMFSGG